MIALLYDSLARRWIPHAVIDALTTVCGLIALSPSARDLLETMHDYGWYAVSFALRPVPGLYWLSRMCLSRALRLDAPPYGITMRTIDTAAVNEGRDVLRGSLWLPRGRSVGDGPFPVVIMRTPYGQTAHIEFGQGVLSERGYAVLYQNTRGRFGSDGEFVPVEHERADGADTVRWVRRQPWCDGRVAVMGWSYLGFTAWACVGASEPGELQAAVPLISQSRVHSAAFGVSGAVALELIVLWFFLVLRVLAESSPLAQVRAWTAAWRDRIFARAHMHTPIAELDGLLLGRALEFYQNALEQPSATGPFWASRDVLCEPAQCARSVPPMHLVTGWYDFFCHECVRDYERVRAVQPQVRLTVGAHDHWGVLHLPHLQQAYRCILGTLDAHLPPPALAKAPRALPPLRSYEQRRAHGRPCPSAELALPIQLEMLGSRRWKGYAQWPPTDCTRDEWLWLTASHGLVPQAPAGATARRASDVGGGGGGGGDGGGRDGRAAGAAADACANSGGGGGSEAVLTFVYDPAAPTPSIGGPSFNPLNSGARTQRALERRSDLLVFTSAPLRHALAVVGHARVHVRVASTAPSMDVVARLCEVSPLIGSTNICEGMVRLDAAHGEPTVGGECGVEAVIDLGPIAAELSPGSRVRLHVCSAAHPRWMRNLNAAPGTPLGSQGCGPPSTQRVWVDDASSYLVLPIDAP